MDTRRGPRMSIGKVSRQSGVNIETIRYYERVGVTPRPARTAGGHRAYDRDQLQRLRFIRRGRELGFSLDELRAILRLVDDGTLTCADIHALTMDHLVDVQRKIADLRRLEQVLKAMAAECSRGNVPECPIIETLFEGDDAGGGARPRV